LTTNRSFNIVQAASQERQKKTAAGSEGEVMREHVWLKALFAGTALTSLALPAAAQTVEQPAAAASNSDEIVVTAQRRSERLVDVPISLTAVDGQALADAGITRMSDLDRAAPGLVFYVTASHASPTIRGVGSTLTGPGADNPVAVYVDGVYQSAASALLFEFDNIDQIEVLRGPQGTLFGRNATGGAIRVTTQAPNYDPAFRTTLSYGRFNDFTARVFGNTPIGDNFAGNVAIMYREADAYIDNLYPGNEVHGPSIFAINPQLRWEPTPNLTLRLSALYADHRDDRYESFAPYQRPSPAYVANPGFDQPGPYEMNTDIPGIWDTNNEALTLNIDYDLGIGTISAISGWTSYAGTLNYDADFAPSTFGYIEGRDRAETLSQEINFASEQMGPFSFVSGIYIYNDVARRSQPFYFGPAGQTTPAAGYRARITTDAWALFAEGVYDITPDLHLTLGLRYSHEEKDFEYQNLATSALGSDSESWEEVTPRAVLRYELDERSNIYASYSQGFKSGTFNPSVNPTPPTAANRPVNPEYVDSYEIGYKTSHPTWRFAAAAFYSEYTDIQVNIQLGPSILAYQNAGAAEIYGVELEWAADLTENLNITAGAAWTEGEYTEFANAPISDGTNAPVTFGDVSGNRTTRTPELTANLGGTYTIPTQAGSFAITGNVAYNSGYYPAPDNRLKQPSYTMVNGELSWTTPDERYRFALWGRNLLDEEKLLYLAAAQFDLAIYDEPLTYGVSFTANFN
jgi:iron complex outermembrane recepter protein